MDLSTLFLVAVALAVLLFLIDPSFFQFLSTENDSCTACEPVMYFSVALVLFIVAKSLVFKVNQS